MLDPRKFRDNNRKKRTSEYNAWIDMRYRCFNKNCAAFHHYGGRGITVCDRWLSFNNFWKDMGCKPGPGYSLDRIDNDGNYEPSNCRWATQREQLLNNRRSHVITAFGKTAPLANFISCKSNKKQYMAAFHQIRRGCDPETAIEYGLSRA